MMFKVVVIKEINVIIVMIIREIIKLVMKKIIIKMMKEIKCYLEDDNSYLKTILR